MAESTTRQLLYFLIAVILAGSLLILLWARILYRLVRYTRLSLLKLLSICMIGYQLCIMASVTSLYISLRRNPDYLVDGRINYFGPAYLVFLYVGLCLYFFCYWQFSLNYLVLSNSLRVMASGNAHSQRRYRWINWTVLLTYLLSAGAYLSIVIAVQ